jgi:hypothetical protein
MFRSGSRSFSLTWRSIVIGWDGLCRFKGRRQEMLPAEGEGIAATLAYALKTSDQFAILAVNARQGSGGSAS